MSIPYRLTASPYEAKTQDEQEILFLRTKRQAASFVSVAD